MLKQLCALHIPREPMPYDEADEMTIAEAKRESGRKTIEEPRLHGSTLPQMEDR